MAWLLLVYLRLVRRLACLNITGAMRSCPTAALETLLGLTPLHIYIQKEAALSALSLKTVSSLKLMQGNLRGHLEILKDPCLNHLIEIKTDLIPTEYNFNQPYKVIFSSRDDWAKGGPQLKRGALAWYTDALKTVRSGVGMGISGPNSHIKLPLSSDLTIFQEEVLAINFCTALNLQKGQKGASINIFTDSRAALKAIQAYTYGSALIRECTNNLRELARGNDVTLWWVPGHSNIEGNEKADKLAKEAANTPFIGPQPGCGLQKSHLKQIINNWEASKIALRWKELPGHRQTKSMITPSQNKTKEVLCLSKGDLRTLSGYLTGHVPLKYHLFHIGQAEDQTCRLCNDESETAEHILCNCVARGRLRHNVFGKTPLLPTDIKVQDLSTILRFIKDLHLP
ncbi:uncharacterized protein [Onthophagus taurus]|uniref:uncharacterized protein n=1 Tax=Onthophagus taurus TaxID=166361 RepID=UPI0039BE8555